MLSAYEVLYLSVNQAALVGHLGTNASIAASLATPSFSATRLDVAKSAYLVTERFRLQGIIRRLLPDENVSKCLRSLAPVGTPGVQVKYSLAHERAKLVGLHRCASVWMCPICSSRISEVRRLQLEQGIKNAEALGMRVSMETFTFQHFKGMPLKPLLRDFNQARRSFSDGRLGTPYLRSHFGFVGRVTALELTYGQHGWHPHCHSLTFQYRAFGSFELGCYSRDRWSSVAARHGLSMNEHGYQIDETYQGVSHYMAKFGPTWSAPAELTKAAVKVARSAHGLTPYALALASEDSHEYGVLFQEYARAVKGLHQLQFSKGLRELLNLDEISDAAIVEGCEDSSEILLALLSPLDWRIVLANDARAELVIAANTGDAGVVQRFIEQLKG